MLRLTLARQKVGMSKTELARRANIGLSEISKIESGKIFPYPGWRRRIAEVLQVEDVESLFKEVKNDN